MLTDKEADEIKRAVADGTRGPVLLKYVDLLLADRAEGVARERGETMFWPGPLAGPEYLRLRCRRVGTS